MLLNKKFKSLPGQQSIITMSTSSQCHQCHLSHQSQCFLYDRNCCLGIIMYDKQARWLIFPFSTSQERLESSPRTFDTVKLSAVSNCLIIDGRYTKAPSPSKIEWKNHEKIKIMKIIIIKNRPEQVLASFPYLRQRWRTLEGNFQMKTLVVEV